MRLGVWLALGMLAGCKTPRSGPAAPDGGLPEPLAAFGPLARPGVSASAAIQGEQGGALPLSDGAMLVVAPGAYAGVVNVRLERVDLALDGLRADVARGVVYVTSTDRDVSTFGAPVTLQVKRPPGPLSAAVWDGAAWKPVTVADGPIAAVAVPHFSRGIFGFVEWLRARTNATDEMILGDDSIEAKKRVRLEQHGNDAAKAFFGIGEKLDAVTSKQLCDEMRRWVAGLPKEAFAFPPGSSFRNMDLGLWLIDGGVPSTTNDSFWKMTEAYMEDVRGRFLAAPGRLAPADMLKLCVETAGGNVPVGVMVCHNFLKEVTYAGRNQPIDRMPEAYGEIARKIMPWRSDDVAPSGYYDKMGPIYHVFAAMAAGTWSASPVLGNAAAAGEALLRTAQRGGDRPDPEKGSADDCGVDVGWMVRKHEASEWRGGALPPPPPSPWRLEDAPPAARSPADAGVPRLVADAGVADGGGAQDAGSPESLLAALDAGPAPADQRQTWEGRWKGTSKTAVTLSGPEPVQTTVDEVLELVVTSAGDKITFTRVQGAQTLAMDLTRTPSNPNAAVGKGGQKQAMAGGETDLRYHLAAFLHTDGRLYIAGRSTIVSTMSTPEGTQSVTMEQEYVAILSKD